MRSCRGVDGGATHAPWLFDVALTPAVKLGAAPATPSCSPPSSTAWVRVSAQDSVLTNAERLAAVGGGGTTISAPLRKLNAERAPGDLVFYVSDNESWRETVHGLYTKSREYVIAKVQSIESQSMEDYSKAIRANTALTSPIPTQFLPFSGVKSTTHGQLKIKEAINGPSFEVGYVPVIIGVVYPEEYSVNATGLVCAPADACLSSKWRRASSLPDYRVSAPHATARDLRAAARRCHPCVARALHPSWSRGRRADVNDLGLREHASTWLTDKLSDVAGPRSCRP